MGCYWVVRLGESFRVCCYSNKLNSGCVHIVWLKSAEASSQMQIYAILLSLIAIVLAVGSDCCHMTDKDGRRKAREGAIPYLPHALETRMTVVKQTPSNEID